jgi:hypothetical protein
MKTFLFFVDYTDCGDGWALVAEADTVEELLPLYNSSGYNNSNKLIVTAVAYTITIKSIMEYSPLESTGNNSGV